MANTNHGRSCDSVKALKISHIGIAVKDLEKAISDYKSILDLDEAERLEVPSEDVEVAFLKIGDSELELLSPVSDQGSIAKFLSSRGEGVHHIAVKVADVSKAIEAAKANGFKVIDEKPRTGARGTLAAFVHPKSAHGVLLEFYSS
jgi:methylmalonyl-CoA/ethylmalonyl-CoA epimerase